jgi:hypothetical protein
MTPLPMAAISAVVLSVSMSLSLNPAKAEWPPQHAFTCKGWRADLYWRDWARQHCRGDRQRRWKVRHVPVASGDARCQPLVPATGDQAQSEDSAYESAITSWRGEVRFLYGERFSDLKKARDLDRTCAPSSVPDSARDRALAPLFRCRISARPCRVEAGPVRKGN